MDNHQQHLESIRKVRASNVRIFGCIWLMAALASIALVGGAIYVVLHFLMKYW